MFKSSITISILVFCIFAVYAQTDDKGIIYSDTFEKDLSNWTVEQVEGGTVQLKNGKLEINDRKGCTVWLNRKLPSDFKIVFDVVMIDSGGIYDHVRDLNFFFKAIDPLSPEDIFVHSGSRAGIFRNYHKLRTYYIGYGGNRNTTTRFRKYPGDGSRPLLPEHDLREKKYLNVPNLTRNVEIICNKNKIIFKVDGLVVFDITDIDAFNDGWFGFRTVDNHMTIDNFQVYAL